MDFITHIREAFVNLVTAKLRSFLAILGILVGTGSVVALIASSQLATAHALAQFKTLGTNLLAMNLQDKTGQIQRGQEAALTLNDIPKLVQSSKQIVSAAPYIDFFQPIYVYGKSMSGEVLGATSALAKIAKIDMAQGRFVSFLDRHSFFCVIGSKLAKQFHLRYVTPIGKQVRVGNRLFTIVGVVKPWTPNLFLYININNGVIIPIRTAYLTQKNVEINNVLFRLSEKPDLSLIQSKLTDVIARLLPSKKAQFRNPEQIIQIVGSQRKTFTWLLGAIGSIALLVGGIGVMNIMLVSVVERRREIGIRMAIGARQSDILSMFLIEAVILTVFGGILGILIGVGVSYTLSVLTHWEFHLYLLPPTLGFLVSGFVGVLSGFYPALRASRLDPIQSLQSE